MRTSGLDMRDSTDESDIDKFIVNVTWAIRSTYHTVLKTTPGAAIFGRDMMFDIPYIADWTNIGKRRQALVDQNNAREKSVSLISLSLRIRRHAYDTRPPDTVGFNKGYLLVTCEQRLKKDPMGKKSQSLFSWRERAVVSL